MREKCYVVAYDITTDRRRNKMAKLLADYGHRVNYSVFECEVAVARFQELLQKVGVIINKKKDQVLFYPLCRSCKAKAVRIGVGTDNKQLLDHIIQI